MNYRERLSVPPGWWVVALFFSLTFVTAVGFYVSPEIAVLAGLVTAAAVAGALLWYGRVLIVVDETGLHAGEALLEWPWVADAQVLDRGATRRRLGAGADHSAWLVVRAFIPGSVEVTLADDADPHPYWLVSSRRPAELQRAIEHAISPSRT